MSVLVGSPGRTHPVNKTVCVGQTKKMLVFCVSILSKSYIDFSSEAVAAVALPVRDLCVKFLGGVPG